VRPISLRWIPISANKKNNWQTFSLITTRRRQCRSAPNKPVSTAARCIQKASSRIQKLRQTKRIGAHSRLTTAKWRRESHWGKPKSVTAPNSWLAASKVSKLSIRKSLPLCLYCMSYRALWIKIAVDDRVSSEVRWHNDGLLSCQESYDPDSDTPENTAIHSL